MNKKYGITSVEAATLVFVVALIIIAVVALLSLDPTGQRGSGLSSEFVFDVAEYAKVDPDLILYAEDPDAAIDTGFSESRAVAVDSADRVYIAGDSLVKVFSSEGEFIRQIDAGGVVGCLAVAKDGRIFVGLRKYVRVFDKAGQGLAIWESLGETSVITSIAVQADDVFVADAGNLQVVHYDSEGNILNYIGRKDSENNITGFVIPSPYFDVAVGRDGLLWAANTGRLAVESYTFDGDREFAWGRPSAKIDGFCGCCNPANFAMMPDGAFVTSEKGLVRVKVYDADGDFVGVVAGPEQLLDPSFALEANPEAFDVAADSKGRVLVLDTIKNKIRIFVKKGTVPE